MHQVILLDWLFVIHFQKILPRVFSLVMDIYIVPPRHLSHNRLYLRILKNKSTFFPGQHLLHIRNFCFSIAILLTRFNYGFIDFHGACNKSCFNGFFIRISVYVEISSQYFNFVFTGFYYKRPGCIFRYFKIGFAC